MFQAEGRANLGTSERAGNIIESNICQVGDTRITKADATTAASTIPSKKISIRNQGKKSDRRE